jgi:dephospho-CoA kinase
LKRLRGRLTVPPPDFPAHVPVIGLAGGVASGKSLVARQLADLGAGLLDGDRAGHEVLRQKEVEQAAHERWGDKVFDAAGRVDRAALAGIVFAPPPAGPLELQFLEQLTHPKIGALLRRQAAEMAATGNCPALVLDAAVMEKAGWDQMCDTVIYVDAPRDVRLARARARGWSEEQFNTREAAQAPLDAKRSRADFVIDNSQDPEHTRDQLTSIWRRLVGPAAR